MDTKKKQPIVARVVIYLIGMVLLALGITLNTQAGLGASAIVSVPYTISQGTGLNFANLTLIVYCVLVVVQFFIKGKDRRWMDLLQVVVSIVFTRFMALFQYGIKYQSGFLPTDLLVLALGILFTGIGAAMTVDMRLIPNPGDGIVSSLADRFGRELGLCKNCFDVFCVVCSLVIGLVFGNPLIGIGLGTVLSMLGVGRVIYFFNHLAKFRLQKMAGL
ncbi:hypothetical protein FYJ75_04435 [Roseburia sp. MUC/MUC-530-WT-4D]|uniref:YitT family protein n=1 Tax=Roseburia porci TaxID=2605790 RepID=A0A6L5YPI6_9FIRM|nr:DUF6198 family protein [Roseburia porci]MST74285.1 hypothetical protein [Roseburia porci]